VPGQGRGRCPGRAGAGAWVRAGAGAGVGKGEETDCMWQAACRGSARRRNTHRSTNPSRCVMTASGPPSEPKSTSKQPEAAHQVSAQVAHRVQSVRRSGSVSISPGCTVYCCRIDTTRASVWRTGRWATWWTNMLPRGNAEPHYTIAMYRQRARCQPSSGVSDDR